MICDLSTVLNNDGACLTISGTVDAGNAADGLGVTFSNGV